MPSPRLGASSPTSPARLHLEVSHLLGEVRLLRADPRVGVVGDEKAHAVGGQLAGQGLPMRGADLRAGPERLGQPLGLAGEFLVDRLALQLGV